MSPLPRPIRGFDSKYPRSSIGRTDANGIEGLGRMTGPNCAIMCNLINTHTHIHTQRMTRMTRQECAVMYNLTHTYTHTRSGNGNGGGGERRSAG